MGALTITLFPPPAVALVGRGVSFGGRPPPPPLNAVTVTFCSPLYSSQASARAAVGVAATPTAPPPTLQDGRRATGWGQLSCSLEPLPLILPGVFCGAVVPGSAGRHFPACRCWKKDGTPSSRARTETRRWFRHCCVGVITNIHGGAVVAAWTGLLATVYALHSLSLLLTHGVCRPHGLAAFSFRISVLVLVGTFEQAFLHAPKEQA